MPARLSRGPREITFSDAGAVPVNLERTCRFAADEFVDRDAEALAHRSGLSPRVVNHQRERHDDRRSALETLCRMLYGAADLGWPFRRRLVLLQPALDALAADAVPRAAAGRATSALVAAAEATVESAQAVAVSIAALADGQVTTQELVDIEREIQEAIERLHRLRRECQVAAGAEANRGVNVLAGVAGRSEVSA
jgi:hypothetical protein